MKGGYKDHYFILYDIEGVAAALIESPEELQKFLGSASKNSAISKVSHFLAGRCKSITDNYGHVYTVAKFSI